MSVNARLALAMLALGHDSRRPAPHAVSATTPAQVRRQDDAASVIADLAEAWLNKKKGDRPTED